MSFSGDLAHLPIVDVIQLIHSTRKTGTLTIKSQKGESQLVFIDGYFASAHHLNNSIRIGHILLEKGYVSQQTLDEALLEQRQSGASRKPLIATLLERGAITPDKAYSGLEALIEITVVEVLTWTSGTFSLDVTTSAPSDEYRYFPETLKQEILINAQAILMDALRIYDEKMRDGTLEEMFFSEHHEAEQQPPPTDISGKPLTADLLGLDDLDSLTKMIPDVYIGLKDNSSKVSEHRTLIDNELPSLAVESREKLCQLLTQLSQPSGRSESSPPAGRLPLAIIVFSKDTLIKHVIETVCRTRGYIVFTTDDQDNLDIIIEQSFSRDLLPLLFIDDPRFMGTGNDTPQAIARLLLNKRATYPRISAVQLNSALDPASFPVPILEEGSEIMFPRPFPRNGTDSFTNHLKIFSESLSTLIEKSLTQPDRQTALKLKESILVMGQLKEAPEVALELLRFAASLFERVITFVVVAGDLVAEKGIGITADNRSIPTGPLKHRIPLKANSVCHDVVTKQRLFFGLSSDELIKTHLHAAIGAPHSDKILLLPLAIAGNVIALIYADFGAVPPKHVQTEFLEIAARHAGMVLDYSLLRKKFDKLTKHP